jgi:hypothetical protein
VLRGVAQADYRVSGAAAYSTLREAGPDDREYGERVRGSNEEEERQIHEGRLPPHNSCVIGLAGVDAWS